MDLWSALPRIDDLGDAAVEASGADAALLLFDTWDHALLDHAADNAVSACAVMRLFPSKSAAPGAALTTGFACHRPLWAISFVGVELTFG